MSVLTGRMRSSGSAVLARSMTLRTRSRGLGSPKRSPTWVTLFAPGRRRSQLLRCFKARLALFEGELLLPRAHRFWPLVPGAVRMRRVSVGMRPRFPWLRLGRTQTTCSLPSSRQGHRCGMASYECALAWGWLEPVLLHGGCRREIAPYRSPRLQWCRAVGGLRGDSSSP